MNQQPIIHIGLPKAASTYIKRAFFRRMTENLIVPRGAIRRSLSSENFDKGEFLAALEPGREGAGRLILSSESLSGGFWSTSDTELVAKNLQKSFPNARVIIILREQFSYLRSVFAFCITKGRRLPPFGTFVEQYLDDLQVKFEYHRLIELYLEKFSPPNVLVLPYELLAKDSSKFEEAIRTFCAMELVHEVPAERKNASIREPGALETIRRINQVTHPLILAENKAKELIGGRNLGLRRPWEHLSMQSAINQIATLVPVSEGPDLRVPERLRPDLESAIRQSNNRSASLLNWDPAEYGYLR